MEAATADGKIFHKTCFKCAACKRTLAPGNFASLRGAFYCPHHAPRDPAPAASAPAMPRAASTSPSASLAHLAAADAAHDAPLSPARDRRSGSISRTFARIKKSFSRTISPKDAAAPDDDQAPMSPLDYDASPFAYKAAHDSAAFSPLADPPALPQHDSAHSHNPQAMQQSQHQQQQQSQQPQRSSVISRVKRAFSASRSKPELSAEPSAAAAAAAAASIAPPAPLPAQDAARSARFASSPHIPLADAATASAPGSPVPVCQPRTPHAPSDPQSPPRQQQQRTGSASPATPSRQRISAIFRSSSRLSTGSDRLRNDPDDPAARGPLSATAIHARDASRDSIASPDPDNPRSTRRRASTLGTFFGFGSQTKLDAQAAPPQNHHNHHQPRPHPPAGTHPPQSPGGPFMSDHMLSPHAGLGAPAAYTDRRASSGGDYASDAAAAATSPTRATGHRSRPQVTHESRESFIGSFRWGSRTSIIPNKVSDALSAFEARSKDAAAQGTTATSPVSGGAASDRHGPRSPAGHSSATDLSKWRAGTSSAQSPCRPLDVGPPVLPAIEPDATTISLESALSMHQPSTAGSASLLEHKPSAADMDPNAKINQLIELQAKIKSSTREILQCCERLKTLPNDQHRKPVLADFLTVFRPLRDSLRRFIELTNSVVTVVDLRRSGIELMKFEKEITSDMVAGTVKSLDEFRHLLASINTNIEFVMRRYPQNERRLMIKPTAGFKEEGSYEASIIAEDRPIHGKNPYRDYILEHVPDAQYYRRHFVNDPHTTYIGVMEKLGPVIISLRKEELQDRAGGGEHGQSSERAYRAILRIKEQTERRELINPAQIKKSILGKVSTRSILQLLHKDLNPSKLKVVDDKSVEQRVMALDELRHSAKYKIGVILVQPGQTTDNEYLGNAGGSEGYERFLGILGDRVELKGFKGFAGGLDTSNGRTGTHSIYTCWRKFEIMFHVATMLPLLSADEQHIDRKRHIGNDIINIVYLEGDAQFDPNSIRSQFTHVFIVVKEEPHVADDASPGGGAETGQPGYRVAVASNSDVPRFGPLLPEPSVFVNMGELREFLMCKMINGENAAYKAPKFAKPHQRTHHAMFDSIIEDFAANMSRKPSRNDSERRHDRFWSREHVVDPSGQHQAAAASSSAAASPASSVMSPMSPQLKPASFVHSSSSNLRSLLPGATPAQSHGASPTSADIPRATAAAAAMDRLRVLHKRASAHVVDRADSNASSPSAGAGGPTAGAAATIPALTLAAALSDTDLRSTSDLDNESLGSGLGDSTSGLTSDSHSRTNLSLGGSTAAAGPGSTTAWLDDPRGLTHTDANAATMCIHDDPLSRAVLADGAV